MKLSLNWLKDYIDIELSPEELGHVLTMAGLEVEGLEPIGQSLQGIVAAKILEISPHPNADRLSVCQIDAGNDTVQVVCGAPHLEKGLLVPFAVAGQRLPNGTVVKESRFKGVMSTGMLLAEDELGLTDDHSGLMILHPELHPGESLSTTISKHETFSYSDWVFDLSITPNRPDWACVLGVARELAAITGKPLRKPKIELETGNTSINDLAGVTINDAAGCPRYAAGMIQGVKPGPSPFWIRSRLYASGIRSINNIVDVTNYVMLETGQPLHAFDYNRLSENRIVVRRAEANEAFTTLDGVSRTLDREPLLICDGRGPIALAGIMGGLNSEICVETRDVLLESAFFDPVTIRRSSKRLGLSTEASYRFERGADIGGVTTALHRAVSLIHRLAGGVIASGIIDQYPKPSNPSHISLRVAKTNRILGTELSKDQISGHLKALDMDVQDTNEAELKVSPPSFRVDITREADLIEEVARLYGYENIPVTYPSIRPDAGGEAPELALRERIRSIMVGLGFAEIITYSFVSPDSADFLGADESSPLRSYVRLLNPLTVDQSVLRTSLIPGLLNMVKTNIAHDEKNLRLFEWGKVFFNRKDAPQPHEKIFLTAVMAGFYEQKTWYGEERAVDFFDIKGALEVLLKDLGLNDISFRKEAVSPAYDPDYSAGVYSAGSFLGQIGKIIPKVMASFDLKMEDAYLFEIDVAVLLEKVSASSKFRSFAKFPAVYRDISLLVNRGIESGRIIDIAKEQGGEWLESVQIFDLYQGKNLAPNEKALSFRLCYRSKDGTLDGLKVNQMHESIIGRIRQETGGKLRARA